MSSPADRSLARDLSGAAAAAGAAGAAAAGRGRSWAANRRRALLALLLPALAVLFVVTILPSIFLVVTSFTPLDLTRPGSYRLEGTGNYRELIQDHRFWNSVWVQARLSFWTVLLQLLIGLGLARLLHTRIRGAEAVRAAFIIPMVLPPVVVALTWKILFTPDVSVLNWALGLIGLPQPAWLTDSTLALWAIIIADVWEWFPFVFLAVLAAFQMMPEEPLEAAAIDGASRWRVFVHVELPLLRPVLLVVGLFRLIDSMKAFPHIFIMTGGGPGVATEATNYYAYLQGFSYTLVGYSSAITVVLLAGTFALSLGIMRLVGRATDVE
ncbi:MAG TPA: sugar ABC transporter permease [Candidatus Binatia bacterium]|nr:sugar ABC transporter permease [Candidatus Binatia bacterium]